MYYCTCYAEVSLSEKLLILTVEILEKGTLHIAEYPGAERELQSTLALKEIAQYPDTERECPGTCLKLTELWKSPFFNTITDILKTSLYSTSVIGHVSGRKNIGIMSGMSFSKSISSLY
ncbi:hypothetical protein KY290_024364 [Solanum tuberosum]|uniref:Uncharacterized protein n=1 Tax=Solanum tuberosum TaxID=4113 RepID=A0ABQ7UQH1_SOLTU|nr:hypothetical protein KY290_024364 [Solanum tuberosum]